MSKLFEGDHPPTVAQAYRVAKLRLGPYEMLASIAGELLTREAALLEAMAATNAANDRVLAHSAQVRFDDLLLDREVIEIAREKRATIAGAKPDQHPSFRVIFPKAPSTAMSGPPDDEQDQYVAIVEAGLALPENAELNTRRGPALAAAKARVANSRATAVELEKALALAEAKLDRVAAAARLAFNEAQLDAASILKDERLVASLFDFRKAPTKKKVSAPE
jgi:hypothetical protein